MGVLVAEMAQTSNAICTRTECLAMRGGWEARRPRRAAYEILDEQFTCPHFRLVLHRPDAMQRWHNQEVLHALVQPPYFSFSNLVGFCTPNREQGNPDLSSQQAYHGPDVYRPWE